MPVRCRAKFPSPQYRGRDLHYPLATHWAKLSEGFPSPQYRGRDLHSAPAPVQQTTDPVKLFPSPQYRGRDLHSQHHTLAEAVNYLIQFPSPQYRGRDLHNLGSQQSLRSSREVSIPSISGPRSAPLSQPVNLKPSLRSFHPLNIGAEICTTCRNAALFTPPKVFPSPQYRGRDLH